MGMVRVEFSKSYGYGPVRVKVKGYGPVRVEFLKNLPVLFSSGKGYLGMVRFR